MAEAMKYRKGFQSHPIRYPVLAALKLSKNEIEAIRATHKAIATGEQAEMFVFATTGEKKNHQLGWSYIWLEVLSRPHFVGVLRKNGIEVALFYKRQTLMEEPGVGEPFPEGQLKEPADAWQKLDLLGPSARQANLFLKKQQDDLVSKVKLLNQQLQARQAIADDAERKAAKLEIKLEDEFKNKEVVLEQLRVVKEHVSGKKIKGWLDKARRERDRQRKKKERIAKRSAKATKEAQKKMKGAKRWKIWDRPRP